MKPEQGDRLGAREIFGKPDEFSLEELQRSEIVRQVDDPVLEAVRRFLLARAGIGSTVSLCSCGCGSSTESMDQNYRRPPTFSAMQITSDS
jgi:hypothetical protein